MLYSSWSGVVLQEVPGEISLAISLSGCNLRCKGCHSTETWANEFGSVFDPLALSILLSKNKHITCVLFYGGEWQLKALIDLFKITKSENLKICLYTGLEYDAVPLELLPYIDFLKTGPYVEELGGITSPNTNQRFTIMKEKDKPFDIKIKP